MKELSIEEKAKRYDDLLVKLQEAKVDYDVCDERYCCVIDNIVPELKESEGEGIRKALLEMVHDTTGDSLWIDYNVHKEDALAWLEKQGSPNLANSAKNCKDEQKPAWSEEDEKRLNGVILDITVLKDNAYSREGEAAYQREIDWLKHLKERYTWKPSDEQIEALNRAMYHVEDDVATQIAKLIGDLKKLR